MRAQPDFARLRARMVEQQLRARGIVDERVLDVMGRVPREQFVPGSLVASAYAAALLAELAREVFTIECRRGLADSAARRLDALGDRVPEPRRRQLTNGGRLVIPVGAPRALELVCFTRTGPDDWRRRHLSGVRFVPLVRG